MFIEKLSDGEIESFLMERIQKKYGYKDLRYLIFLAGKFDTQKEYDSIPEEFVSEEKNEKSRNLRPIAYLDFKIQRYFNKIKVNIDMLNCSYCSWTNNYIVSKLSPIVILNDFEIDDISKVYNQGIDVENSDWQKFMLNRFSKLYKFALKIKLKKDAKKEVQKIKEEKFKKIDKQIEEFEKE